jgi:chromosome segregation ATPase
MDEVHRRLDALETEVGHLRDECAHTRSLAAMADRDAADMRATARANTQLLGALRETQLEQGRVLTGLAEAVAVLAAGQADHGARLERIEATQVEQGERLGRVETTLAEHGTRLERIETTQAEQGERLGRVETTLAEQGERLGRVETTLAEHGTRLTEHGVRLERIETGQVEHGRLLTTLAQGQEAILVELRRLHGDR